MTGIEYRDVSTHYPRKVRLVETAAKAELESVVASCVEHLYDRRYLMGVGHEGNPVVFAFYYRAGSWWYDIIGPTGRYSSCSYSEQTTEAEAWERCQRHFKDYCETYSTPIAV